MRQPLRSFGATTPLRSLVCITLVFALLTVAPPVRAAEPMPFPADVQLALLLKVITYDRSFQYKAKGGISIGVVYMPADADSVKVKDDAAKTLSQLTGRTIKNVPISFVALEWTTAAAMEKALRAAKVNVFYLAPGTGAHLDELLKLARTYGITTATGVPEYVARGVTIGIGKKQDKPDILINLPSSRKEGSEYDAALLRIANVIAK